MSPHHPALEPTEQREGCSPGPHCFQKHPETKSPLPILQVRAPKQGFRTQGNTPLGWKVGRAPSTKCASCEGADVPGEPRAESTGARGLARTPSPHPLLCDGGGPTCTPMHGPSGCSCNRALRKPQPQATSSWPTCAPYTDASWRPRKPSWKPKNVSRSCPLGAEFLWECCHLSSHPNF